MKSFPCSTDRAAKIVPWFIGVICLGTLILGVFECLQPNFNPVVLITFVTPVIMTIVVYFMYKQMPVAINIDKYALSIERKKSDPVQFNYSDIRSITHVPDGDMKMVIRTFGNGGVFGYTGSFYNKKYGSMKWYCTRRQNYILLETTNKGKIVFTPDSADDVIAELKKVAPMLVA